MGKNKFVPDQAAQQKLEIFSLRRQKFDAYLKSNGLQNPELSYEDKFFTCPGCGFPTLHERRDFEVCSICNWEDDGQDDTRANEVWNGPNGEVSLSEHRLMVMEVLENAFRKFENHPDQFLEILKKHFVKEEELAEQLIEEDDEKALEQWEKLNEDFIAEINS